MASKGSGNLKNLTNSVIRGAKKNNNLLFSQQQYEKQFTATDNVSKANKGIKGFLADKLQRREMNKMIKSLSGMMNSMITANTVLQTSQTDIYNALKEQGNKKMIEKLDKMLDESSKTNEILAKINNKEPVTPEEIEKVYSSIKDTKEILNATGEKTEVNLAGMANYLAENLRQTDASKEQRQEILKHFQSFLRENRQIVLTQFKDTTEVKKFMRLDLDKTEMTTRRINSIDKLLVGMGKQATNKEITMRLDALNNNFGEFITQQQDTYDEMERERFGEKVKDKKGFGGVSTPSSAIKGGIETLIYFLTGGNTTLTTIADIIMDGIGQIVKVLTSILIFTKMGGGKIVNKIGKVLGGVFGAKGLGKIFKGVKLGGAKAGAGVGGILGKVGAGAGKVLSKVSLGGVLKGAGRVAGKAFLPVTLGLAALEAYSSTKKLTGEETTVSDKVKAGMSGAMSSVAFGLVKPETIYNAIGGSSKKEEIPPEYNIAKQLKPYYVSPKQVATYLKSKGLTDTQIAGILANIQAESSFNAGAIGDNGTSGGLFQHHATRFEAMKKYAGDNWKQNWKGQIDYALSEPEMKTYLSNRFKTSAEASIGFTHMFEKPANIVRESLKRAEYSKQFNINELTKTTEPSAEVAKQTLPAYTKTAQLSPLPIEQRVQKAETMNMESQVSSYQVAGSIMNNNIKQASGGEKQSIAMTQSQLPQGAKTLTLDDTGLVLIQSLLTS